MKLTNPDGDTAEFGETGLPEPAVTETDWEIAAQQWRLAFCILSAVVVLLVLGQFVSVWLGSGWYGISFAWCGLFVVLITWELWSD